MNSLPFISHHLFVAAIGSEGRGHENPVQRERQFTAPTGQRGAMALDALEVMDARKLLPESAAHASRARVTQALT
jgi:hypothetical protein